MTVEEKIRSVVEAMGIAYMFEDWSRANKKADKSKYPLCINVLPVAGSLNFTMGLIKDSPYCLLAFVDKAKFDFNGEENDQIIERMKTLAKRFVVRCNESGLFEPITGQVKYSVLYDKLDVNVTGITIQLTLQESRGTCEYELL